MTTGPYSYILIQPPEPGIPGQYKIKAPGDKTVAYCYVEADAQSLVAQLNRPEASAADLGAALSKWLDENTVKCGHGGVLCGICWAQR